MNCANHPAVVEGVARCSRCNVPYCSDCVVMLNGRRYCARCKTEQLTDIRSGVDATEIRLAGIGRRFAAIWLDGLILGVPMLVVFFIIVMPSMMANTNSRPPSWMNWIGYALTPVYIVYEALMLRARGQTLGKMALGIRVVQPGGNALTTGQAWGRAVVRGLFISFLSIIDLGAALFTKEKTCIHDMVARTRVVLVR